MSRSRRPTFLTILDLADQLQVSDKTVRRWIKSGELVAHKLGDQYRISEADLELFLRSRRLANPADYGVQR